MAISVKVGGGLDLAEASSVQKIERRLDHGASSGWKDIVTAADLSIELR